MAIGDGNISNPNKKAYRLRITCDARYPGIIHRIVACLKIVFPKNKVSLVNKKDTAFDVSVYNKKINEIFGWKLESGKKYKQKIAIPKWIDFNPEYTRFFIKGLFESDGSIYKDRGYTMANLVSYNKEIVDYVITHAITLGFRLSLSTHQEKNGVKYTARIAKDSLRFIEYFDIQKN